MQNFNISSVASVIINNTQPSGYRRAGISFNHGQTTLSGEALTQDKLNALQADPRLSVQVIQSNASTETLTQLDADHVGTDVTHYHNVDYTQAPQELQPIVAIMIDKQLTDIPNCNDLAFEAPAENEGEVINVKVTKQQRDKAWQWLQAQEQEAK